MADAADAGRELRSLGDRITWTTRLRRDAALFELAAPATGKRGRPRLKGGQLPCLATLGRTLAFTQTTVSRYGTSTTVYTATITCLWYSVFGFRPVRVVLLREPGHSGYQLALVSTDTTATPAQIIGRYAARWSIEVAIQDAKQLFGVGQARNRIAAAVRTTVPFTLTTQSLTMLWYATAEHHPTDATEHSSVGGGRRRDARTGGEQRGCVVRGRSASGWCTWRGRCR